MRVAILADVHGNDIALDAVLADARSAGAEQYWVLGDHCALGPEPATVLERLATLESARFIRGNSDRYVVTGERPPPHLDTVRSRPELIPIYAGIAASFAWTKGYLTAHEWLDWLDRLPLDFRTTSPAGHRILGVHASPGMDDGDGLHPGRSNAELRRMFDGCGADIVFVGHTHQPMVRRVGDILLVNTGAVSNPLAPDLRASYVLLEMSSSDTEIVHRRIAYDHAAFIESVHRSRHPAADFIVGHQRGELQGRTPHPDHTEVAIGERVRV